jgi:MFS family permease
MFLLDAGLSNTQAFMTNAFFTVGQVLFEVPTGLVADLRGRRLSYLLGTVTLAFSTAVYLAAWYVHAPMGLWAVASILLGLGFAFFSGATEAWLVDALTSVGYTEGLEKVFAKGQMVSGGAMLVGSVAGGVIAQATNLSVPYLLRIAVLLLTGAVAFVYMRDWGWQPEKRTTLWNDTRKLFVAGAEYGWRVPAVRWTMLAAPFASGVGFYAFYAMQPFLLQLYGDPQAYAVAGLAAAIVAGSQIVGGMSVPYVRTFFAKRTSLLVAGAILNVGLLVAIGFCTSFWLALLLLCGWGLVGAATQPVRQAFLNGLIPSKQRATVLSFDALLNSAGGVVTQPALGRVADVWSYGTSFMAGAAIVAVSVPFIWSARQEKAQADSFS